MSIIKSCCAFLLLASAASACHKRPPATSPSRSDCAGAAGRQLSPHDRRHQQRLRGLSPVAVASGTTHGKPNCFNASRSSN